LKSHRKEWLCHSIGRHISYRLYNIFSPWLFWQAEISVTRFNIFPEAERPISNGPL